MEYSKKALFATAGFGLTILAGKLIQHLREVKLNGQAVLVTGGSKGLGLLLAREFAQEGCRIAICARDERELGQAQNDLSMYGKEILAIKCDVSDRLQVDHLIEETMNHFGGIDVLVNNAGIIQVGPVETMTLEDFEKALDVMFWGVLYPTLAVLPQMLRRKSGRIVNITSIGGKVSVPHLIPYCCAKFAAVALSEGLRSELCKKGVKVTTIVPGLMRTGSYFNALFKGKQEKEFTWFSLGSSLPFISMDAERAARQIVSAVKRGESERILSVPANLLAEFHGIFPGITSDILGLINRIMLPEADGIKDTATPGLEVYKRIQSSLLSALTTLGLSAARRFQHYDVS
ncbi:MAG TPA: SDR family NAD(P)-dependent oxidoreductase [Thermodesulfobacteriota bacterium]|nr:SDR family NAD(P)-dependent oxidoreductase [Thermodesulfobacteriota bacterium]